MIIVDGMQRQLITFPEMNVLLVWKPPTVPAFSLLRISRMNVTLLDRAVLRKKKINSRRDFFNVFTLSHF